VGNYTGDGITTGARNMLFGSGADASAVDGTDQSAIGNDVIGKGNDTFTTGGGNGVFNHNNTTAWQQTSDKRIKKNIVNNNIGLEKIAQIQVKNFEYRTLDEITDFGESKKAAVVNVKGVQIGAIAQEIEKVLPELVITQSTGVKTVNPTNLTWYMINAIKELKAEIDELKKK